MKVAFYPGCVFEGRLYGLYVSAKLIAEPLGSNCRSWNRRRAPAPEF